MNRSSSTVRVRRLRFVINTIIIIAITACTSAIVTGNDYIGLGYTNIFGFLTEYIYVLS